MTIGNNAFLTDTNKETVADVKDSYHRYGDFRAPTIDDIPALLDFVFRFDQAEGNAVEAIMYGAYVDGEIGFATQSYDVYSAARHYDATHKTLRYAATRSQYFGESIRLSKDEALFRLLTSWLAETERCQLACQQATIKRLGNLAIRVNGEIRTTKSVRLIEHYRGVLTELVMQAALLLPTEEASSAMLIVPASPRQDRPYALALDETLKSTSIRTGVDGYIIRGQANKDGIVTIPTQIKSIDRSERESAEPKIYHPSILMLYGDRELYTATSEECGEFAHELRSYGRSGYMPRILEIARSNVELAVTDFLATQPATTS